MLALLRVLPLVLSLTDVPVAAAPAPTSSGDSLALAPSGRGAGEDLSAVVTWPMRVGLREGLLLASAAGGTALLLHYDVSLYAAIHRDIRWNFRGQSVFDSTLYLGDGLVDLGLVSAFCVGDARAQRVTLAGVEALSAVALTSTLGKHVFRVERPEFDPNQKHYFGTFGDDAFPSGHTMSAFAVATVISGEYPEAAPVSYAAASLVGLSVIERGWHWPSDVLAGAALGTTIGWVSESVNHSRWSLGPGPGAGLATSMRF